MLINTLISVFSAHLRTNKFIIHVKHNDGNLKISYVNFVYKRHSIRKGQPFDHISSDTTSDKGVIKVKAGRKSSRKVASDFTSWTNGNFALSENPKKLNFAVEGELTVMIENKKTLQAVKAILSDIVIAQGHTLGVNNWYLGGPNCKHYSLHLKLKNEGNHKVTCRDVNHHPWCFTRIGNNIKSFYLEQGRCNN